MNILGLRAFSQIMASGTLTAAAKGLNISPSALSRQLAILEQEIGLKLFRRERQRLVPTEEGQEFYDEARRLLHTFEEIPEVVERIKRGRRTRLKIVVMPRLAPPIAIPAIAEYLGANKEAEVMVEIQPRRMVERWIANSQFDLGLGPFPAYHKDVEVERLGSVPPVVVLSPQHRLAHRKSLSVEEVAEEEIIAMPQSLLIGSQVAKLFEDAGVQMRTRLQTAQSEACCNFVALGAGLTVTDALSPLVLGDKVKIIPLETKVRLDFGLIFPRGIPRRQGVDVLANIIRRHADTILTEMGFRNAA